MKTYEGGSDRNARDKIPMLDSGSELSYRV